MSVHQRSSDYRLLAIVSPSLNQSLCSRLIQRLNCEIDVVHEWSDGIACLAANSYDAVLAEFHDESPDQVPAILTLKKISPDSKIIVLVQDSTARPVIEAMRAHAFSYFSSPFDLDAICEMIRNAASSHVRADDIELMSMDPDYVTVTLRCSLATADRLVQFMSEMPSGLSEDDRYQVATAFREMLMNAIEHGGKFNPAERVRVSRVRTRRTIVYHIRDSGDGFSRVSLAHAAVNNPSDPTAHIFLREEVGMRYGGFGMLIASRLVDEVIYNEQGNEVILIKYLS